MSWPYDDPPARLAERLGVPPGHRHYSGIGGTTPQVLVNDAAESIARGEVDVVVIAGAEALDTKRQLKKVGERPTWSHRHPEPPPMPFEAPPHPSEIAHEVFQAWLTFALFDVARRARLGTPPDAYRERLGRLLAPMTDIAAANPHAWFPVSRSADEIITATPENRMVGYPYTKYMVSMMDVDMAGAIVLASEAAADDLGVDRDRRVYLRGHGYANDPWVVAERADLSRSAGMAAAGEAALVGAGVGIDDVAHFDLYSCFSSSVLFARDALGIAEDDDRAMTVTGGLPYAGGPASNYMLHSIAAITERLRADPGSVGLVSGVGMHMAKHVYAAYSTTPGQLVPPDPEAVQREADARGVRSIVEAVDGSATVAAYSVIHGRDGAPESGVAVLELADDARGYARFDDAGALADAERHELVGQAVHVSTDGGVNTLSL